jgi:lysine-specific demethylase 3
MMGVPFPDMTRLDGVLNMASHFPWNGISPDLGEVFSGHAPTFKVLT